MTTLRKLPIQEPKMKRQTGQIQSGTTKTTPFKQHFLIQQNSLNFIYAGCFNLLHLLFLSLFFTLTRFVHDTCNLHRQPEQTNKTGCIGGVVFGTHRKAG